MAIEVKDHLFSLSTNNSLYQMKIDEYGVLNHTWYGAQTSMDMSYIEDYPEISFSANLWDAERSRLYSLNDRLLEYPGGGISDFRLPALSVSVRDGSCALDLRYHSYEVTDNKYKLSGLPASFEGKGKVQTLKITMKDTVYDIYVDLLYGVFEEENIITRAVIVRNLTFFPLRIHKVMSACLDLPDSEYEVIHFHGRHAMERMMERTSVDHGAFSIGSRRGQSSHQHNPGLILARKNTTEVSGDAYGMLLVYSGSFLAEVEKDQLDQLRAAIGLGTEHFEWTVLPGEKFTAPEAILSFTEAGLGQLSRQYHEFIREHVIRSEFVHKKRPILINNWEATYFDFDGKKLLEIAETAHDLGIDLFVLDDGWFGNRHDDDSSLGDWMVNEEKLRMPLKQLVDRIHAMNMQFGIWIEPEMISEKSNLHHEHPEWVLRSPNRYPARSRYQLVLDMANPEVIDHLENVFAHLIEENGIDYIKWDMNRSISDFYSPSLSPAQQGEMLHRYMLGVYDLADRLTSRFPDVLFEGCAGGGGRFDAGMLYYFPQYWCSDDTDAHNRCFIQYGTSFFYPISATGSHVSAVPNHQSGRVTSLRTRAVVAMAGTFGYELDLSALDEKEKEEVIRQIADYRRKQELICEGDYYRLTDPNTQNVCAWSFVSKDKRKVLVQAVVFEHRPNAKKPQVVLQGLEENGWYRRKADGKLFSGNALMKAGIFLPNELGTDMGYQIELERIEKKESIAMN